MDSLDYFKRVVLVGEITERSKSSVTGFLMAHASVLGEGPTQIQLWTCD